MIKRLIDIVLFTSLFIAFGAIALVGRTYLLFELEIDKTILFFAFTSTLFTYNLTKVITIFHISKVDLYAYNRRNQWNIDNKNTLLVLTILPAIVCSYLFLNFNFYQQLYITHLGIVSILYTLPFLKGKTLRDFPFLKIFLISYVWAGTSILPIIEFGISEKLILLFLENFLFILAITLPFDIRDYDRDKSQSIKTIPQNFGIKTSKYLAIVSILVSSTLLFFIISDSTILILNLLLSIIIIPIILISSENKGEYYYLGLIDGLLIIKIIILLI